MSPITVNPSAGGGTNYASPFVGRVDHTAAISVDLSAMTNKEIDAKGYLKPGIPLTDAGALLAATDFVYGVTIEPLKVIADNSVAALAAAPTIDVAVATICQVNRAVCEDMLERAYSAAEIAGFELAGSKCVLLD